jgi:hypothetical protein
MMPSPLPFRLPEDGTQYARLIFSRCKEFVRTKIWSGIDLIRFDRWLATFNDPLQQYFAACVLDRLIYRSSEHTRSLITQLFQRTIPNLCRSSGLRAHAIDDWRETLRSRTDPGIRVVPVIRDIDPPTKSGPLLVRLLRRYLALNERWMIWPWQVQRASERGIGVFLFVDDFLGTGHQFRKFAIRADLAHASETAEVIYAPLLAYEPGLTRLAQKLPWLHSTCVEMLDCTYDLFSQSQDFFAGDGTNTPAVARQYYVDLMIAKGWAARPRDAFGYGGLALAVAFEHATPNASLPILWNTRDNLIGLFDR